MSWLYALFDSTLFNVRIMQRLAVLVLWEKFLNVHPIKAIVELGTLHGGFSQFLLMQAIQRNMGFWTFDVKRCEELDYPLSRLIGLSDCFYQGNIFEEAKERVIEVLTVVAEHPLLLYCDNGNKPREVQTFTPFLRPGDYVAVHDYSTEFKTGDIEPVKHLVRPIWVEECKQVDILTRIWERVDGDN